MPTIVRIAHAADERLADYRGVPDPELLRMRGLFVAEGRAVVERLVVQDRDAVRSVLVSAAAYTQLEPVLARLGPEVPVLLTSLEVIRTVTGFNIHRGCLAIGRRPSAEASWASVGRALGAGGLVMVLERLADADNVGSIFRTSRAFGVAAVLLGPTCCDPLYRKAIRVSMGAVFEVPYARLEPWPQGLEVVRQAGYQVVALTPSATRLLDEVPRAGGDRIALVVGAEGEGLSPAVLDLADERIRIPMQSGVDSLNVATAAAVALHWLAPGVVSRGGSG